MPLIIQPQVRLLAYSGTSVSHTGDTNETILATVTIKAGTMTPTSAIRVMHLWSQTGTNTKTMRIRFNGIGGTIFYAAAPTTQLSWQGLTTIRNRDSLSSQVGFQHAAGSHFEVSAGAVTTSSIDTSADVDLVFTGQLTNTGETVAIAAYIVELVRL